MEFLSQDMPQSQLFFLLARQPDAIAELHGAGQYKAMGGRVFFYQADDGTVVIASIQGLPRTKSGIFAMHIHNGESCTGSEENPFADADGHYNPEGAPHPEHRGDLPPLFDNQGKAWSAVFTDRFTVQEVLGKTVIIHLSPDNFTTQPSGAAGEMIACGRIEP